MSFNQLQHLDNQFVLEKAGAGGGGCCGGDAGDWELGVVD
jgi:hypothetical protein